MLAVFCCLFMTAVSQNTVREDSITLQTPTGNIYGTLRIPNSVKPIPLALIIAGSGFVDRDGNAGIGLKNNSLKMLAEGLSKNGIASLRFDKRGIAQSAASMSKEADIRFDDYVNDVRQWVEKLKSDKRFSFISIVGHSEGSLIGIIVSENNPYVKKYVSIAGAGNPLDKILKEQMNRQFVSFPALKDTTFAYIDRLKKGERIDKVDANLKILFQPSAQPYLISIFKYNPQEEIKKLNIPILILQGNMDIQVGVKEADSLASANPKAKKVIIENMSHVMKDCNSMDMSVQMPIYTNPDIPIKTELVNEIVKFLKQ